LPFAFAFPFAFFVFLCLLSFPRHLFSTQLTTNARIAVAERTLPHNLEAERSVLGAIRCTTTFNLAAEVIDSRFLPRPPADLRQDGEACRTRRCDRSGDVEGGADGRRARRDRWPGVHHRARRRRPRSTNAEHYARIIKEKATLRNLIYSANKILTNAYEGGEEADVILDQAEHAIFAIADDKVRDGFVCCAISHSRASRPLKDDARKELITGVPTGFTDPTR
jgi:replicative DNA helicase